MTDADIEYFANNGLGLGEDVSKSFLKVFSKACILLALPLSFGIASVGLQEMASKAGSQPVPVSYKFYMLLAGVGIGGGVTTLTCSAIKTKIQSHLALYSNGKEAVAGLKPATRTELRNEAFKLIRIADAIDEIYKQQNNDDGLLANTPSA